MKQTEKYEEILKVFEKIPHVHTPLPLPNIVDSEDQQFIVIDHNSSPSSDFSCYAELESDPR